VTTAADRGLASALTGGMPGSALAEGSHEVRIPGTSASMAGHWLVTVHAYRHEITRSVLRDGRRWPSVRLPVSGDDEDAPGSASRAEVIWPTWPATLVEETAMATSLGALQQTWDASIGRLRDSAKWTAAVLGAALASIIPTANLSDLAQRHLTAAQEGLGLAGLVFAGITIVLVLRVMRPRQVSYDSVLNATAPRGLACRLHDLVSAITPYEHFLERPLYRWQRAVNNDSDLYLPCGVSTLEELRQLLLIEEITLTALARAREDGDDPARVNLTAGQAARAAHLHEIRSAAARITAMGAFYRVRACSTQAMYGGAIFGMAAIAAIVTAIAWPVR
jgi:hypothetical protein